MSNKNNVNKDNKNPNTNNNNGEDKFSFLELDKFLAGENIKKESTIKQSNKKNSKEKKIIEKNSGLKFKPNISTAREQTSDDIMYLEKDDNELNEEIKKEEKIEPSIPAKNEKNIQKGKKNLDNKKFDKRIVKINLDKDKKEDPIKNKNKDNLDLSKEQSKNKIKQNNYTIESIINDIKSKDPKAYTPVILPFGNESTQNTNSIKDNLTNGQNNLFIFQFPRQIPIKGLENQIKIKEEENVNEEPNYDENGFLISPEFKNTFQEIKGNTVIGKLVIMKSGKVKIKMGDIYFDINQGSLTKFAQYSTVVSSKGENQAYILGQPLNKKLIVTPEFD